MEEEVVRLIKRIVDERIKEGKVHFFDVEKANELAIEMGLDVACVKSVIEELNRLLEDKLRAMKADNIP